MKPASITTTVTCFTLILSAVGDTQAATIHNRPKTALSRVRDHTNDAELITRTSPMRLVKDLIDTSSTAASTGTFQSLRSLSSEPAALRAAPASPAGPSSSLSGSVHIQEPTQPDVAGVPSTSGNVAPNTGSTSTVDSSTPYKGRKYKTREEARLAKGQRERELRRIYKESPVPVTKRAWIRRLDIPEGATAEDAALARKLAKRGADKISKLKQIGERYSPLRQTFNEHQKNMKRTLRAAQRKSGLIDGRPGRPREIHQANVTPQAGDGHTTANQPLTRPPVAHLPSASTSTGELDQLVDTFPSVTRSDAAEEEPKEEWLQWLAPELS